MNKVILVGRLTKDPEVRYSQGAEPLAIARYTLAVNRRFKKEGEPDADFILCVTFGKQAEFIEKYFKKGMQLALSGRITVRSYDDNSGQRRWVTEVVADEVEFTESRGAYESHMANRPPDSAPMERNFPEQRSLAAQPLSYEPEGFSAITDSIDDDDLPF